MKHRFFLLSAAISVALAGAPSLLFATTSNLSPTVGNGSVRRVTDTVSNANLATLPKTHLANILNKATSSAPLNDAAQMNHLQLILKPSTSQMTAMEATIANQHDPKSAQFHHWLTPQQFGSQFGVADSDIAAVTSWLTSQGFVVNSVYPNKAQIDFSGTVAQIRQAFHTQENTYTIAKETHVSNSSDISVPAALQDVVTGVMGLNDFRPTAFVKKPKVGTWNASKKGFVLSSAEKPSKVIAQAVGFGDGSVRGLAPNDMSTIYGIRTLRANGVTGTGINIAVVEDGDMVPADWTNFVSVFNLGQFNGTFKQFNPPAPSGTNNCIDPSIPAFAPESDETVLDAEWATAIAPSANIWVSTCADYTTSDDTAYATPNFFGGTFIAATNLINATDARQRPDIISASYGYGEHFVDAASKTAIDYMWSQADAEGISVFVSSGDSGSNPSFNGSIIQNISGNTAIDANAFATSPHVTAVGGTDFADVLRGTTSQYFAPTPSSAGGSALSYVPEIPWNQSCGNGVAAVANGYNSAIAFCNYLVTFDYGGLYLSSEGSSGGPSSVDRKPAWQRQVLNAAQDQSRDLPDVSLFAGSYGEATFVITCTSVDVCQKGFGTATSLSGGTSLSAPMFAGIQALIDQGLTRNGLPADQGNAAPTLYALAADEYGNGQEKAPASLAACDANNGASGTAGCVFHNVTSGSISTNCAQDAISDGNDLANCYYYGTVLLGNYNSKTQIQVGLTSTISAPTSYTATNKSYPAGPGWSFASGLGSVNATNLLIAWRAFVHAPKLTTTPSAP